MMKPEWDKPAWKRMAYIDIWRAAHLVMQHHGSDAARIASERADGFMAKGDVEGQLIWSSIAAAIVEWQDTESIDRSRPN